MKMSESLEREMLFITRLEYYKEKCKTLEQKLKRAAEVNVEQNRQIDRLKRECNMALTAYQKLQAETKKQREWIEMLEGMKNENA